MRNILFFLTTAATLSLMSACTPKDIDGDVVHKNTIADGEVIEVTVSASLDAEFRQKALLEDPETAPLLSALWTWESGAKPELHYDREGTAGIALASACTIDAADPGSATFLFEDVPADACVTGMVYGSPSACGQVVSSADRIGSSSLWMDAEIAAEAGTKRIDGVVLKSRCAYFEVYAPFIMAGLTPIDVSGLNVYGTSLLSDGQDSEIDLDFSVFNPKNHWWFILSNDATDVHFYAKMTNGSSAELSWLKEISSSTLVPVRDPSDLSELITVHVKATMDRALKEKAQAYAALDNAWQWSETGTYSLRYSAGGFTGEDSRPEVIVDPADPNAAELVFSGVPKKARVTGIFCGSPDNLSRTDMMQGEVDEQHVYAAAEINEPAGTTLLDQVDLVHQGSYFLIDADRIEDEGGSFDIQELSLSGSGTSGLFLDVSSLKGPFIAYVPKSASGVQIVAGCGPSEYLLVDMPAGTEASEGVYKVDASSPVPVTYATVLFADGTLIINEKSLSRQADVALHGSVSSEYAALKGAETYDWSLVPDNASLDTDNEAQSQVLWFARRANIQAVEFGSLVRPVSMRYWFAGCSNLTSFDATNLDTGACLSMYQTFQKCSKLTTLDASGWNVSALEDMTMMFSECSALTSLDISDWDVSSLKSLRATFQSCTVLPALDISAWRPVRLVSIESMFDSCSAIDGLDFSQWNCPAVSGKASKAFYYCFKLTSLDLHGFGPGSLTMLQNTFSGCSKLQVIDISGLDTSLVTDFQNTFRNCGYLVTIYVGSGFSTESVVPTANYPFNANAKLVGGNGTGFNQDLRGYDYLCVDAPGHPGYLTLKQ
ncbi:MAG: BspA family leucine-rich repeat surface protein [Bacteroidales bacterium]|nr:BspA family leucine-rich repeat surface protein [Bacteroidales bacterium]